MRVCCRLCFGFLLLANATLAVFEVRGASCFAAPDGLIDWWPGDGNALTIFGTNNGSLQGGATATNVGFIGNAFTFDGTNNFVQIPDSPLLHPTNFTVEAWVRFSGLDSAGSGGSPAGDQYIFFKQNTRSGDFEGIDLSKTRIGGSDYFRFLVTSATSQFAEMESATVISTGAWYHVAAVRGANFTQLYVNGVLERQTNVSFAQDYGTLPLYFGTSGQSFWDHKLKGNLDEVSFYNRPLSSNEIAAIFLAGNAGKCKAANIATQPQSVTLVAGANAQFTVAATGIAPLTYQWRFNGINLANATNTILTITNIQPANAGNYTVMVSNSLGSATSSVAVLTVLVPPNIILQPTSQTNVAGTDANFTVAATGTPAPGYQWQFNGANISGATAASLLVSSVQADNAGTYAVIVTNLAGSVTSSFAVLTVWLPPLIGTQPSSRTNLIGTTASFFVNATGTAPLNYQWQFSGANIGGANGPSLILDSVQPSAAGNYAVVITNVAGAVTSSVAALTVWVPPVITTQPLSRTNITGTDATFSVAATGTPTVSYQWQFSGNNIPGATSSAFTVNNVQLSSAGNYAVAVTNSAGSVSSAVATLTVWAPPSISTTPANQIVIAGSNAVFNVVASGTLPLSYQWLANGIPLANAGNISGATTAALAITAAQPNNAAAYAVVITNVGGSLTSSPAFLTVNVPPSLTTTPQSQTVIAGSNVTMNVSASGTLPISYRWQLFGTNLFDGGNISGATSPNLTIFAAQTNNAGPYTVFISNVAASLTSSPPAQLIVNVPPSITSQPQSLTVLVGSNVTFTVGASGTAPLSYRWRANGIDLVEGPNFIGTATPTLSIPNAQQINSGTYTVLVTNAAASVLSSPASLVVVNPDVVVFCDTNLEDAVRLQLGKPAGDVTRFDLQNLTFLSSPDSHITCLGGLEWATNLNTLYLGGNLIGDISVLTNFTRLTNLFLPHNLLVDLSALAALTNLSTLDVRYNPTIANFGNMPVPPNLREAYFGGSSLNTFGFIPTLSRLTFLGFESNPVTNLAALAALPNLTGLDLSYNSQADLQQLAALTNLTSLYLSGSGVTNLSFVQSLKQLTNLSTRADQVVDLSPLTGLLNLRSLNLTASGFRDVSVISSLSNLESLWLNDNLVTNIAFLQSLSRLTFLNIDGNLISNLSPLAALTNMNILSARQNLVTNSTGFSSLTNLLTLNLDQNFIVSPTLPQLPNRLNSLGLSSNNISSLQAISSFTKLQVLDVGANPITDYSALSSLSSINALSLYANSISNVSFLQNLSSLVSLDLRGNTVADLSPLSGLTNLLELDLAGNLTANISPLVNLVELNSLDLSSTPVTDWSSISRLTNLIELYVQSDSLSDLSWLPSSASLAKLDVSLNRITNSAPASALKGLHYFLASQNHLTEISSISDLPRLWYADLRTNLLDFSPGSDAATVISALAERLVPVDYLPQNQPPTINLPAIWPIAANVTSAPLLFNVSDDVTASNLLSVSAISSNVALIPISNIQLGITASNRSLTVTPVVGNTGNSLLTLIVTDETALSNSASVLVTVVTQQNVSVPDANLRTSIRTAIGKPSGTLNNVDMLKLTRLTANFTGIADLTGLEWASNLTILSLAGNSISNLSKIQNLPNLRSLTLDSNPITNVSQLAVITSLTQLSLVGDSVTSVSFASNLTALTSLNLGNNLISDLSPLTALSNLNGLFLSQNIITNISVLLGLPHLADVDLTFNLLDTSTGSAAMAVISALQSSGSLVFYLPQRSGPGIVASPTWHIPANFPSFLRFNVINSTPPAAFLTVGAVSSNTSLLPNTNLNVFQNADQTWTLKAIPNQPGNLTVTLSVTDNLGLKASQPVAVTVVASGTVPSPILNNPNLTWTSWGDAFWFGESIVTHDGISAAQSGHIHDNQESWLGTTIVGPGRLSFWWRVSSETNFDFLEFFINDEVQTTNSLSGEINWQQKIVNVPVGTNVLRWGYIKDQNTSMGTDAGWLDEVSFAPGVWLELAGPPVNGQAQLILHAIPGNPYEIQVSTNLVNWSRLILITPTNTSTAVFDNAAGTSTRFYRLHDLSLGMIYFETPTFTSDSIRLVLHSPINLPFRVLTSTNLKDWTTLTNVTNIVGTIPITNSISYNFSRQFYRAQLAL